MVFVNSYLTLHWTCLITYETFWVCWDVPSSHAKLFDCKYNLEHCIFWLKATVQSIKNPGQIIKYWYSSSIFLRKSLQGTVSPLKSAVDLSGLYAETPWIMLQTQWVHVETLDTFSSSSAVINPGFAVGVFNLWKSIWWKCRFILRGRWKRFWRIVLNRGEKRILRMLWEDRIVMKG